MLFRLNRLTKKLVSDYFCFSSGWICDTVICVMAVSVRSCAFVCVEPTRIFDSEFLTRYIYICVCVCVSVGPSVSACILRLYVHFSVL